MYKINRGVLSLCVSNEDANNAKKYILFSRALFRSQVIDTVHPNNEWVAFTFLPMHANGNKIV